MCFPERGCLLLPSGFELWGMTWHVSLSMQQAPCNQRSSDVPPVTHFPRTSVRLQLEGGRYCNLAIVLEIKAPVGVGKALKNKWKQKPNQTKPNQTKPNQTKKTLLPLGCILRRALKPLRKRVLLFLQLVNCSLPESSWTDLVVSLGCLCKESLKTAVCGWIQCKRHFGCSSVFNPSTEQQLVTEEPRGSILCHPGRAGGTRLGY